MCVYLLTWILTGRMFKRALLGSQVVPSCTATQAVVGGAGGAAGAEHRGL